MTEFKTTQLPGIIEIIPRKIEDSRGFFSESYNAAQFREAGIDCEFVQDNHSYSVSIGVLRGLHFQMPPFAQAKLVRVTKGRVLDVVVDIRSTSPTFKRWSSVELSAEKWNQLFIPVGFAHGFVTLEPETELLYKVSAPYSPEHDCCIRFDDPEFAIDWRLDSAELILSEKDEAAPRFSEIETGF